MTKGKKRSNRSKKAFDRHPGLWRAQASCRIGREALNGEIKDLPAGVSTLEYAMYNLLHAVEDIAAAMMPKEETKP